MRSFLARMWNRVERLEENDNFKLIRDSEKAFIIATGPSLNRLTPLQLKKLKKQFRIGVNGAFKKISCNVMCCADIVFILKYYKEMTSVKQQWLLFESAKNWYKAKQYKNNFFITYTHLGNCVDWGKISFDISKGAYSGHTVVVEAIQVALSAGCKEIYLLGVDCDYSGVSYFYGDDNPNPKFPQGRQDQTPVFKAFTIVKRECDKHGVKIYNCSKTSKLKIFPYKRLSEALR